MGNRPSLLAGDLLDPLRERSGIGYNELHFGDAMLVWIGLCAYVWSMLGEYKPGHGSGSDSDRALG